MISAVGIVVPARDEAALIGSCVAGIRRTLARVPPGIDRVVCVLADRCTDDTARIARAGFGGASAARVVLNRRPATIGEVRDLGFQQVTSALAAHPAAGIWLLSTDADTEVPADWVTEHLRLGRLGLHAVAGPAELTGQELFAPTVAQRYAAIRTAQTGPEGHGNVYAANLGIRADAYRAVGGFASVTSGEDQDLWERLASAGYRLRYADSPTVRTSARQQGRAPGGVSALLARLHAEEAALPTAS